MTAQIGSIYNYNGVPCNVVAEDGYFDFNPRMYGLNPTAINTACWRGYWCEYDIKEDGLFLKNLFVHCDDGNYPDINGVSAKEEMKKIVLFEGSPDEIVIPNNRNMDHHVYENLNMKMDFNGTIKILVGKKFLSKYYIHMGYQMFYAYEELLEFILSDGKITEIVDHSQIAQKVREDFEKHPEKLEELENNPFVFVDKMFSLNYEDKAWWLK